MLGLFRYIVWASTCHTMLMLLRYSFGKYMPYLAYAVNRHAHFCQVIPGFAKSYPVYAVMILWCGKYMPFRMLVWCSVLTSIWHAMHSFGKYMQFLACAIMMLNTRTFHTLLTFSLASTCRPLLMLICCSVWQVHAMPCLCSYNAQFRQVQAIPCSH